MFRRLHSWLKPVSQHHVWNATKVTLVVDDANQAVLYGCSGNQNVRIANQLTTPMQIAIDA
jgi:hypothetical protein